MMRAFHLIIFCFCCYCCCDSLSALHVKGVWNTGTFFHYLTRFGFQKTVKTKERETQGYVYGNISSDPSLPGYTLAIVHEELFPVFYETREHYPKENVCQRMFERLDCDAGVNETEGILRGIPGIENSATKDYQFIWPIKEFKEPRFWFLSMVACRRVSPCRWEITKQEEASDIQYSVWLVNGSPDSKSLNPLEHQFSYDEQDIIEIYLVFLLAYVIILPIQTWAFGRQNGHPLPRLLTAAIGLELAGIFLNLVHFLKFASDGVPVDPVRIIGNLLDSFGQSCLILILILIARGCCISAKPFTHKTLIGSLWGSATILYAVFFAWNLAEEDEINDLDQWSTWPGYLALSLRIVMAVWFVYELNTTFTVETSSKKLKLFLHVGAGFLVWFVYLPIVALIGVHISALYRFKTILCISYTADFLAIAALVHLFWPERFSQMNEIVIESTKKSDHKSVTSFTFAATEMESLLESPDSPARENSAVPTPRGANAILSRGANRDRHISRSCYGAEEPDHSFIAELLEDDNEGFLSSDS